MSKSECKDVSERERSAHVQPLLPHVVQAALPLAHPQRRNCCSLRVCPNTRSLSATLLRARA
eukprot:3933012-Rhodomonas_salina.2